MFSSQNSQVAAAATQAEAIDYDGTNDYLSRSSALSGSSASKTFTFSCWMWLGPQTSSTYPRLLKIGTDNVDFFEVIWTGYTSGSGNIWVQARTSNSLDLNWQISPSQEFNNTWIHLLVSCDMANSANRSVYINDISQGTGGFSGYNNATLPFNRSNQYVAYDPVNVNYYRGRISNLFLDLTYRDMSVTANRRLFVTADLKPAAGQAALNPLVYLTMADPTQPGKNSGTGGDFTLTGTVARSGRGPNQYNAPVSKFNGSTQYMSRPTVGGQSKQLTLAFNVKDWTFSWLLNAGVSSSPQSIFLYGSNTSFTLTVRNSANTTVLSVDVVVPTGFTSTSRWVNFVLSFDLSNTSKRAVYVNGTAVSAAWNTYTNDNMDLSPGTTLKIGTRYDDTNYFNGQLSAFYLSQNYIDLGVAANLAKFVTGTGINAAPADLGASGELPTGTSPLIYLPMYANRAGKNYGTGGDFTVNSGPYTGARGPNEFWGNKADFDGTTGYLSRTSALSGVSDSATFSLNAYIACDTTSTYQYIFSVANGGSHKFLLQRTNSNYYQILGWDSSGTMLLLGTTTSAYSSTSMLNIQICVDLNNTSKRFVYINGQLASMSWGAYSSGALDFTTNQYGLGTVATDYSARFDGKLSEFYFTTDYIDFSQEANRLKFRDCFGNPTNLPSAITALSVPNPTIYMRFDPASFGTNSGTGGNFTVNGTITDGGQL